MDELLQLPQSSEIWTVASHPLMMPAKDKKPAQQLWVGLVQTNEQYFVLASSTNETKLDAQELLFTIVDAITQPLEGSPRRPTAIEMGPNLNWGPVIPMLEAIGIQTTSTGQLYELNVAFQHMSIDLTGKPIPNLPIEEGE